MTMFDAPTARAQMRELTWAWWLMLLVGVLSVVAGALVLAKPSNSLATLAVICGVFALVDGIFELVFALIEDDGLGAALLGILGIVIGILLVRHPIGGVTAVALLVGIWLLALGVVRLVRALGAEHRGWHLIAAAIEIIAGIVIVSSPRIGFATLALLVGISFIVNGIALCGLGWILHNVKHTAKRLASDEAPGVAAPEAR
jgi:uncharacterized membrane protein HdeD (DUF308 family)